MRTTVPTVHTTTIPSPIGPLTLRAEEGRLTGLLMDGARHAPALRGEPLEDAEVFGEVISQLEAYFAGTRRSFEVPLEMHGTSFQCEVWAALCDIPYGETISYGELARRVGRPGASRAVGLANGRNPVAVIVPCHRVIGADGSLTGYGGGLDRKRLLLELEATAPR